MSLSQGLDNDVIDIQHYDGVVEGALAHLPREFIAGGTAGSIGIFIGFPFDLIKTKLQVYPDLYRNPTHCVKETLKAEGFRGLYKGCLPPIMSQGLVNSLLFVGESTAMKFLQPELKSGEVGTPFNTFMAGCFGGMLQCIVLVPSEVVKCTMQAEEAKLLSTVNGVNNTSASISPLEQTKQCVRNIYRTEGVRGFYRGLGVTALREAPSIGLYFFAYKYSREAITALQGLKEPSNSAIMLAGGIAGAMSWTVVYPLDVLKTNVQIQHSSSNMTAMQVAKNLYAHHGVKVFFRGLGTTILRAFPVNASTFYCYEKIKKKFHFE